MKNVNLAKRFIFPFTMKQPFSILSKYKYRKFPKQIFLCRFMFSKLEGFVPNYPGLLLMDVNRKLITEDIAKELGVSYLSDSEKLSFKEVHGIIWGVNCRIFVPLIVEIGTKSKIVIFLVDTGSPHTFISLDVLNAMKLEARDKQVYGKVNGCNTVLSISPNIVRKGETDYRDINILGGSFLTEAKGILNINYILGQRSVVIKFF